ncbi:hypothetical protein [Streptacidiphilus jiangxiensis]|uniref:Uncharacterized protein n=1 Tax=Streptacidiphilus jiangxiensis TaxID=235985 RepID=A0A1H7WJH8_STRJI|nr:hypothetical protein [Streptacidiphilus jiangxiensis]SEM21663.1 hypothetical protein SAMN05414137_120208 [Streptacidiphilus jiangxiensis]
MAGRHRRDRNDDREEPKRNPWARVWTWVKISTTLYGLYDRHSVTANRLIDEAREWIEHQI